MKTFHKIGIGFLLLGGVTAPVFQQEMPLLISYQYPAKETRPLYIPGTYSTTTGTGIPNPERTFTDDDANGWISASVFKDSKGNLVYQQISETLYAELGDKNGITHNPKKTETVSALGKITPKAHAAIAYDTSSTGAVTGTSLTFSHTMSATANGYIACGVANENNVDDITGVTYNSIGMTQLQLATPDAFTVSHQYLFGLANPSTGANNVVVSRTSSGAMSSICLSHTGVNQVSVPNGSGKESSTNNATSHTFSATTTSSTAWAVAWYGWQRSPTASTGITQRNAGDTQQKAGDSNGIITSPYSMTYTYASCATFGCESAVWLVLDVPAAVSLPGQDLIIIEDQ